MIRSLDDARRWYDAVRTLVGMMDRMARRYWDEEHGEKTLRETLHRDEAFKRYEAAVIRDMAGLVAEDLDDLAVLLLFSVFEATVRDRVLEEVDRELVTPPRQPALVKAVADARDAIRNGSFGRLTEAYKPRDSDLKTRVDQVRQYRNWVAHGRRGAAANNVDPDAAFERLGRFLRLLDPDAPADADDPADS